MHLPTDPELIAAWRTRRDEDAFRELVARHGAAVRASARRRLDDPESADDVAAQTFALLAQRPERARGDRLAGWLVQVAIHLSETENRTRRRRIVRERRAVEEMRPEPAMSAQSQDLLRRVEDALVGLRPDERECVLLHHVQGMPLAEVAQRMGVSEGAVRMRTSRALERLRKRLGLASGVLVTQLEALREPTLSISDASRLAQASLTTSSATVGGAALGWILMTTSQKIGLGLAATLILFLAGGTGVALTSGAKASPGPARPIPSFAGFVGKWKGELEYQNERTGRRVKLPAKVEVSTPSGDLRMVVRYDDPEWNTDSRLRFAPDGRTFTLTEGRDREEYRVLEATPDQIVGVRSDTTDRGVEETRMTLGRQGTGVRSLIEVRRNGGDWKFANEHRMERER